jgi:hypothetical protein
MIKSIEHCHLCEHKEMIPGEGIMCMATMTKPDFIGTCGKKEFSKVMHFRLIQRLEEYETIKYSKKAVRLNFYAYGILGTGVVIGAYLFYKFLWSSGWFSMVPLIIGVMGFTLLGYAIGPINNYRSKLSVSHAKLEKMTAILALYNLSYDFEIIKRRHEEPEMQARITRLDVS